MDKIIYVFAGPNGSGKTTVINKFLKDKICPEYYICPDNLVPKDQKDILAIYIKAMEYAEYLRHKALNEGNSFTFETVLSTRSKLDFIVEAKSEGYKIVAIYITTSDCNININRIAERVKRGGHDVPTDKVISRYEKSMDLMFDVISVCDEAKVYDNSSSIPIQVFQKNDDGSIVLLNREQRHSWVNKYLIEKIKDRKSVV